MTRTTLAQTAVLVSILFDAAAMARASAGEDGRMTAARFALRAGEAAAVDVALARVAIERATDPDVSELARRTEEVRVMMKDELRYLAARMGWSIPERPAPADRIAIDRLSALSGPEFDRQYVETVVKSHDRIVAMFENYARDGQNSDLKTWAASTLPDLREHARTVRSTALKIGVRVAPEDSRSARTASAGR